MCVRGNLISLLLCLLHHNDEEEAIACLNDTMYKELVCRIMYLFTLVSVTRRFQLLDV